MCGRYALVTSTPEIARILGAEIEWDVHVGDPNLEDAQVTRYNVAPTQVMPVARLDQNGSVEIVGMKWGLVPFWAKDVKIGNKLINARAETAAEKPSFRAAFSKRRCLIPASGYFEWTRHEDGAKQPHYIRSAEAELMFFAGLWESWRGPDKQAPPLLSFSILTADSGPSLAAVHHRMPVLIGPDQFEHWLKLPPEQDRAISGLIAAQIAQSQNTDFLTHPVSSTVNSPRNDEARCVQAIA